MEELFTPTLFAKNIDEWRNWLENNGSIQKEIYLIIYHKNSKVDSIHWNDAIEHALCFGWVDSHSKKRDPDSCYLRFSPRKKNSTWGKKNIERAEEMIDHGFMCDAGLTMITIAKDNGKWRKT